MAMIKHNLQTYKFLNKIDKESIIMAKKFTFDYSTKMTLLFLIDSIKDPEYKEFFFQALNKIDRSVKHENHKYYYDDFSFESPLKEIDFSKKSTNAFETVLRNCNQFLYTFDDPNYWEYTASHRVHVYIGINKRYDGGYNFRLYSSEEDKSDYCFIVAPNCFYLALFALWAYFSSDRINKRSRFSYTKFKTFGICSFEKDDPAFVTKRNEIREIENEMNSKKHKSNYYGF